MEYVQDNYTVQIFVASLTIISLVIVVVVYAWMQYRYRRTYWHHGVRLPYLPDRPCWYLVGLSIGCRPWAGHEGDVYVRLIGTHGESEMFLMNGETHPRLNEAESHLYVYSCRKSLGVIQYIDLVCGASMRKKRWFLSSVHVLCVSGADRGKHWYFPYHEWIEVFIDPVRVTLCGVDIYHDIYKRLLLGWLSRGVSDFHLWLSILSPLKYTRFRRAERFLCCGAHLTTLTAVCMFLNQWVPDLGIVLLGLYTSAITALPIYLLEWLFRITARTPKVILEDVNWYTGYTTSPVPYDLSRTEYTNVSSLTCLKDERDQRAILEDFQRRDGILSSDAVFWRWIIDADKTGQLSFVSINFDILEAYDDTTENRTACSEFLQKLKECCCGRIITRLSTVASETTTVKTFTATEATPRSYQKSAGDTFFSFDESPYYQQSEVSSKHTPEFNALSTQQPSTTPFQAYMQQSTFPKAIDLKQSNFEAIPQAIWRVNSNYSIVSMDLGEVDLNSFTLLQSMPVSQFDGLRPGKAPLMGSLDGSTKQSILSGSTLGHLYRRLVSEVSAIELPAEAKHLSFEEGQLVSMIYFDLCTKGFQWLKPGTPQELFTIGTDVTPDQNWMQQDPGIETKRSPAEQKSYLQSLRSLHPEPIPCARIFSMMMFPEYAKKLSDAYEEMAGIVDMQSCVSELFVRFAESIEGCCLFCDACVEVAKLPDGRQALCNMFSGARKSEAWSTLICTLSQRLQFQGDNIKRIRRKYDLNGQGHLSPEEIYEKSLSDQHRVSERKSGSRSSEKLSQSLFREMDQMLEWCKKLENLSIPNNVCLQEADSCEFNNQLSKFFRAMILDSEGCSLFIELMLQVSVSKAGMDTISRVLRFIASQCDGAVRMASFHKAVGESGPDGRRLLLRMYSIVKRQSCDGSQLLERVANCLRATASGKLLIADLQVDGKNAHVMALRIKNRIYNNLDPYVKSISQCLSQVILRMNEIARCMLAVANHSKAVLDGKGNVMICHTHKAKSVALSALTCEDACLPCEDLWTSQSMCTRHNEKETEIEQTSIGKHHQSAKDDGTVESEFHSSPQPPNKHQKSASSRVLPCNETVCSSCHKVASDFENPDSCCCFDNRNEIEKHESECSEKSDSNSTCWKCNRFFDLNKFNEFFLQTRNYENFFLNYNRRPSRSSDDCCCMNERSKDQYKSSHCTQKTELSNIKSVASKWGRDVKQKDPKDTQPPCGRSACDCRHDDDSCQICKVAHLISEAADSSEVDDIIADHIRKGGKLPNNFSSTNVTESEKSAAAEEVREACSQHSRSCPNARVQLRGDKLASVKCSHESSEFSETSDKGIFSNMKSYFGFGSSDDQHQYCDHSRSNNYCGTNSSCKAGFTPFPSAGTTQRLNVEHIDNFLKPHNIPVETQQPLLQAGKVESANLKDIDKGTYMKNKLIDSPTRPITAKDIRKSVSTKKPKTSLEKTLDTPKKAKKETESKNDTNINATLAQRNGVRNQQKETKIYPVPGAPITKFPQEYWQENCDEESEFSRPELKYKDELEYCEQYEGEVKLKQAKDLTYTYRYLINHDKGPRNTYCSSLTSSSDAGLEKESLSSGRWKVQTAFSDLGLRHKMPPNNSNLNGVSRSLNFEGQQFSDSYNKIREFITSAQQRWIPFEESIFPNLMDDLTDDDEGDGDDYSFFSAFSHPYPFRTTFSPRKPNKSCDKPITKKSLYPRRKYRQVPYPTHKLPGFSMTESETSPSKGIQSTVDGNLTTSQTSLTTDHHSVCSDCRFRIGTQQCRPCDQYLLPLKAVRSYQEAIRKFGQKLFSFKPRCPSVMTDSGVSTDCRSMDMLDSDVCSELNYPQTLLDLMGITKRLNGNTSGCNLSACSSYISINGPYQSSTSLQTKKAKRLPILQLQGFGCEPVMEDPCISSCTTSSDKTSCSWDLHWWRRHDDSLHLVQQSVDEFVKLRVLLARTKEDAITDHERTCKVCRPQSTCSSNFDCCSDNNISGKVLGIRYSQMLPTVWKAKVAEAGQTEKQSSEKSRFYHQLVQAAVNSTRTLLFAPDDNGVKRPSTRSFQPMTCFSESSLSETCEKERQKSAAHLNTLAHFREMIISLKKLQKKVGKVKKLNLVTSEDINTASRIRMNNNTLEQLIRTYPIYEEFHQCPVQDKLDPAKNTIVDSLTDFVTTKMCGCIHDCREVLSYPWQFPIAEQQSAGKFLERISDFLNKSAQSKHFEIEPCPKMNEAIEGIIESYLGDIIFKATTQTCIQKAVSQATIAKQLLAYLEVITRLCLAKLHVFSNTVQYAIENTRKVIKSCLDAAVGSKSPNEFSPEWWRSIESQSNSNRRDESDSTMDDVIIGFERLRNYVRNDLCLANFEALTLEKIMDKEALWLFEETRGKTPDSKKMESYDSWTVSEVAITRERICQRISKSDTEFAREVPSKHIQFKSHSMLELFGSSPDLKRKDETPDFASHYTTPANQKSILVQSDTAPTEAMETKAPLEKPFANKNESSSSSLPSCFDKRAMFYEMGYSGTSSSGSYGGDEVSCSQAYDDESVCTSCTSLPTCPYHGHSSQRTTGKVVRDLGRSSSGRKAALHRQRYGEYTEPLSTSYSDESFQRESFQTDYMGRVKPKEPERVSFLTQKEVRPVEQSRPRTPVASDGDYDDAISLLEHQLDDDKQKMHNVYKQPMRLSTAVTESRAEAAQSGRQLKSRVSEDTIEETVLVRDRDAQVLDVIKRKSRSSERDTYWTAKTTPFPSGKIPETESEDPYFCCSESSQGDSESTIISDVASTDTYVFFSCESQKDEDVIDADEMLMKAGGEDVIEAIDMSTGKPQIKNSKESYESISTISSVSDMTSEDETLCGTETSITDTDEVTIASTLLSAESDYEVSLSATSSAVSKTKSQNTILKPSTGPQSTYQPQLLNSINQDAKLWQNRLEQQDKHGRTSSRKQDKQDSLGTRNDNSKILSQEDEAKKFLYGLYQKAPNPRAADDGNFEMSFEDSYHHPTEMKIFQNNVISLLELQSGQTLPHWTSIVLQFLLAAMSIFATFIACYKAFITGYHDKIVYSSVPIAFLAFLIIVEPLKCIFVAWSLFLVRRIPAFYCSPVYIKSNPVIVYRGSLLKPKTSAYLPRNEIRSPNITLADYQDTLYRKYIENRPRAGFNRHQRRVLPSIAENVVTLNFNKVQPFGEVEEATATRKSATKHAILKTVYSASSLDRYSDTRSRPTKDSDFKKAHFDNIVDDFFDPQAGDFSSRTSNLKSGTEDFTDTRTGDFVSSEEDFVDAAQNAYTEELSRYL